MSGPTLIRYSSVRLADNLSDQYDPQAISNAYLSSSTQEDLQEFYLSQLKRVIHGPFSGQWKDDFETQGILSLQELSNQQPIEQLTAECLPTDNVWDVVSVRGDSVAGVYQVGKANPLDYTKLPGVCVILSKTDSTHCVLSRAGIVYVPTGLVPGKVAFLGANGEPTTTRPVPHVGQFLFIQTLGVAMDSSRLLFNPSFNLTRVRG